MFDDLLDDAIEDDDDDDSAVVGIDLGTTNSVVAWINNDKPEVVLDSDGVALQPSVVNWMPDGTVLVGTPARRRRVIDPPNTVYSAKRIIGQSFRSPGVQGAIASFPYEVVEGEQEEPLVVTRGGRLPITQVSSLVLRHMRELAQRHIGKPVEHCVVTVPANFSDGQRAATRKAAELAGMEVLRVLNEPTAAALAYGQERQLHERIAVFDLGGGTFDLTLLAVRENVYEVIATGGDPFLGGDDIDNAIATKLANDFLRQHRVDPHQDPAAWARLLLVAEQIKLRLSDELVAEGALQKFAYGAGGAPLALEFRIERPELEMLAEPIIARALATAREVLATAGVEPTSIGQVILVGGSTRVPLVQQRVAEQFQTEPRSTIDTMRVVAMGAAIQARNLFSPGKSSGVLMDVTPHSLGIATTRGYTQTLIQKNTRVPAEGIQSFTPARDFQESVEIRVCQRESKQFADNVEVCQLKLEGLPNARRNEVRIEVAFFIDADGILKVTARDLKSGKDAQVTLKAIGVNEVR